MQQHCIFCSMSNERIFDENRVAYAIFDNLPVSEGHTLIISKRHEPDYFLLTKGERCWIGLEAVYSLRMLQVRASMPAST